MVLNLYMDCCRSKQKMAYLVCLSSSSITFFTLYSSMCWIRGECGSEITVKIYVEVTDGSFWFLLLEGMQLYFGGEKMCINIDIASVWFQL